MENKCIFIFKYLLTFQIMIFFLSYGSLALQVMLYEKAKISDFAFDHFML